MSYSNDSDDDLHSSSGGGSDSEVDLGMTLDSDELISNDDDEDEYLDTKPYLSSKKKKTSGCKDDKCILNKFLRGKGKPQSTTNTRTRPQKRKRLNLSDDATGFSMRKRKRL
uniref:Uncharacterized protein n=1 Tax=Dikerogammarus haemobaphes virus 1 TaxID=2704946 RepID=A0A6G9HDG8_9VIRU|nr:hypothetical protein [Dikerogammarus haemobaphes virus 1]